MPAGRSTGWKTRTQAAALAVAASALLAVATGSVPSVVQARGPQPAAVGSDTVALQQLPRQGRDTYSLILRGGPFPYDKDGAVFGNRERLLPLMKRGYYREYTVKTPWSRDRGARRIICGGFQPTQPDACYYTADHYASFKQIVR